MFIPRHQKTYLSRAMTRAMALDHPIGDPHGGPAYGERNDPISAIISIGTLFATGGAVLAGTASLMTGLAFAGAAISLVGNVTGNSTLSKIGMVVGIAGGIGSLAESAGMFSSGTLGETFGYGAGAASGAPTAALSQTVNPAAGADVSGAIVESAGVVSSPVAPSGPVQGVDLGPLGGAAPDAAANATQGLVNSQVPVAPGTAELVSTPAVSQAAPVTPPASTTVAAPTVTSVGAPTAPTTGMSFDSFGSPVPAGSPGATMADPTGLAQMQLDATAAGRAPGFTNSLKLGNVGDAANAAWTGFKDIGKSWLELGKTNPAVALMMGNTISSVADVISGKADAQVNALEQQGQLSKTQADKLRFEMEDYKRRIAQQNSNYANVANPLATWKPPTPQGYTPMANAPTSGIIGGAMQPVG
jgi:hypothetical protein